MTEIQKAITDHFCRRHFVSISKIFKKISSSPPHLGACPIVGQLPGKSCLFSGLARKSLAPTHPLSVFHQ